MEKQTKEKSSRVLEEVSRHPRSLAGQSDLRTFVVPSPDGDSEAGCGEAILLNFEMKSVNV